MDHGEATAILANALLQKLADDEVIRVVREEVFADEVDLGDPVIKVDTDSEPGVYLLSKGQYGVGERVEAPDDGLTDEERAAKAAEQAVLDAEATALERAVEEEIGDEPEDFLTQEEQA